MQEKTQEPDYFESFVDMERNSNLTQMIIEKAFQIEENMKMDS